MKRFLLFLLFFIIPIIAAGVSPRHTRAQTPSPTSSFCEVTENPEPFPVGSSTEVTFTMRENCLDPNGKYYIQLSAPAHQGPPFKPTITALSANSFSFTYPFPTELNGQWQVKLCKDFDQESDCLGRVFELDFQVGDTPESKTPTLERTQQETCAVKKGNTITFKASNVVPGVNYDYFDPNCVLDEFEFLCRYDINKVAEEGETELNFEVPINNNDYKIGPNTICIDYEGGDNELGHNCITFEVTEDEPTGRVSCEDLSQNAPTDAPPQPPCPSDKVTPGPNVVIGPDGQEQKTFAGCGALYTGLGFQIGTNPAEFVSDIFAFLLSISGGILLLLIIYSGYQLMTSQGNPERIQAARERITSAIVGFMFLIFSLVILEVIGVDILHIPGFYETNNTPTNRDALNSPDVPRQNEFTPGD